MNVRVFGLVVSASLGKPLGVNSICVFMLALFARSVISFQAAGHPHVRRSCRLAARVGECVARTGTPPCHHRSRWPPPHPGASCAFSRQSLSAFACSDESVSGALDSTSVTRPDISGDADSQGASNMAHFGNNYAIIKAAPESSNIVITINWQGREINMDRQKSEQLKSTIRRLKRSLHKTTSMSSKRARVTDSYLLHDPNHFSWKRWEDREANPAPEGESTPAPCEKTSSVNAETNSTPVREDDYSISFMTNMFKPFDESDTLELAAQSVSFISINDTLLQVHTNVFRILDITIGPKAMVGCPVSLRIRSEGPWRYEDVFVEWLDEKDHVLHRGPIYIPPDGMEYRCVKARVLHKELKWNVLESSLCQVVDIPKNRWQHDRILTFNTAPVNSTTSPLQSDLRDLRVVSFNILSPTYVATEEAIERFFPYCSPEWLDSSYRNPLVLREILMLKPQILCLQECATSAYREYLEPVLSQHYHSWLTIKNLASDEGCCIFLQKGIFDILDIQSVTFKEEIRKAEYREVLNRIGAPHWVNYHEESYFSRHHTIFQMGCFKNALDDKRNFLFLANTHLYFHPQGRHIRILQAYMMLNELERFKQRCAQKYGFDLDSESSTIICGDFNSFNTEGAFQLMSNGWVPCNHADFEYGIKFGQEKFNPTEYERPFELGRTCEAGYYPFNTDGRLEVANCSGYVDAYSGRELHFTNFVKTFSGTLDYIFHSKNLKAKRCMPGISKKDAQEYEGLPSKLYPSDHISIAVDF